MANETPNRVAGGLFVPLEAVPPPFTDRMVNVQGITAFERLDVGQYLLTLQTPLAFASGYAEAALPANQQMTAGAQITPDGTQVFVSCFTLGTGEPVDPPVIGCTVWTVRESEGKGPSIAVQPVPPPIVSAAALNTEQVYWDQPGISPMVGTTSAQAMMAPYPGSKGITRWWVWWGFPPAVGANYKLRLYRYRNNPGFTYTQISDPFDITTALTTYNIFDLTSYLRPNAADFEEAKNDVLALSVVITGGTTQLRALTQRVQFGVPDGT